jgi:hypothetical protein
MEEYCALCWLQNGLFAEEHTSVWCMGASSCRVGGETVCEY